MSWHIGRLWQLHEISLDDGPYGQERIQLPSQGYADDKEFWTETLISNEVTSTDPHHKLHTKEGSGKGKENNKH